MEVPISNISNATTAAQLKSKNIPQLQVVDIVLLLFYCFVFVVGVGGNILVIRWFSSDEKRNRPGSLLVIVLAINDLVAAMVTSLYEMNYIVVGSINPAYIWYLGKGLCKSLTAFTYMFLLTTPWLLVAIATERFQ